MKCNCVPYRFLTNGKRLLVVYIRTQKHLKKVVWVNIELIGKECNEENVIKLK
jgi:hypothetical protein